MNLSGIAWLATISFALNINKIIQLCVKIIKENLHKLL